MNTQHTNQNDANALERTLTLLVRIGVIFGLLAWCFLILKPFLMILLWGMIIAVAIYPAHDWLRKKFGDRPMLSAILLTLLMLLVILLPFFFLGQTLYDSVGYLKGLVEGGSLAIPAPPESVKSWPLIGNTVFNLWAGAQKDFGGFAMHYQSQLKDFLAWIISIVASTGLGILLFIVSVIVSGIFLAFSTSGGKFAHDLMVRLAGGDRGHEFADTAKSTIRSVTKGILGVAMIQSFLAGMGFLIAGVPGAGLWALLTLFFCIIQIGVTPVCAVVVIYMFFHATTTTAVILMIWCILISFLDNILKPLLLGRGASSPMLVIFLGAIGGFLLSGIIGLFVGAVVLALGYDLFMIWLRDSTSGATLPGRDQHPSS
jgi:predicted PurR-regulated permease PerM